MAKTWICTNCTKERRIIARGVCTTCYRDLTCPQWWCCKCWKIRQLRSKWMCGSCLEKERLLSNPDKLTIKQKYLREYSQRPESKLKSRERAVERRKDMVYMQQVKRWSFLRRLKSYGISEEFYMSESSRGCAICKSFERLHIDHDHTTWQYRGILCGKCNQWIWLLDDSISKITSALNYLISKST